MKKGHPLSVLALFIFFLFQTDPLAAVDYVENSINSFGVTSVSWVSSILDDDVTPCADHEISLQWQTETGKAIFKDLILGKVTPNTKKDAASAKILGYEIVRDGTTGEGKIIVDFQFTSLHQSEEEERRIGIAQLEIILNVDEDGDGIPEAEAKLPVNIHGEKDGIEDAAPPTITTIYISDNEIPVPQGSEYYQTNLLASFDNPNGELIYLAYFLDGPEGLVKDRVDEICVPDSGGMYMDSLAIDASFPAGDYQLTLEVQNAEGRPNNSMTAFFTVTPNAEKPLEITNISPAQGEPGDFVILTGRGFAESPQGNSVKFKNTIQPAEILEVHPGEMKVLVPDGAISGPISLQTDKGFTRSQQEFFIVLTIELYPDSTSIVAGQSISFSCLVSGVEPGIIYSIIDPGSDEEKGTIDYLGRYTAPSSISEEIQVDVECASTSDPSLYTVTSITVIPPLPEPELKPVKAEIGGEVTAKNKSIKLTIPPGALLQDAIVSIETVMPDNLPSVSPDHITLASASFEPSGIQFAEPAQVSFMLRNWTAPGTLLEIHVLDDATETPVYTGKDAVVDDSGRFATGELDHFSTFLVASKISIVGIPGATVLQDYAQRFDNLQSILPEYKIVLPPDIEFLEGLSVPVLVQRRLGPGTGPGPFATGVSVIPVLEGYSRTNTPLAAGPIVQPSPDGWELATVIQIPKLTTCGGGEIKNAELQIDYERAGSSAVLKIPFQVGCLDELSFSGETPPANLPEGASLTQHDNGALSVNLLPGGSYRFSEVNIGQGGLLRVLPDHAHHVINPTEIEVTGDVLVYGEIDVSGLPGENGNNGSGADGSGAGGSPGPLGAGSGGTGGPWRFYLEGAECFEYMLELGAWPNQAHEACDDGGEWFVNKNGRAGADGRPWDTGESGGGGNGGLLWEQGSWLSAFVDGFEAILAVGRIIVTAGADISAYYDLIENTYGAVEEGVKIYNNDENMYTSGGFGGTAAQRYKIADLSEYELPRGPGGGGGGGKMEVDFATDKSGGGGGGGGGSAPNLELVVNGTLFIDSWARINGRGGNGGIGGNGASKNGGPGGGGAGGNGSQIQIIANEIINNGQMDATGGVGGLPGGIKDDDDSIILIPTGFGAVGKNGRFRIDGNLFGAYPKSRPWEIWFGPRIANSMLNVTAIDNRVFLGGSSSYISSLSLNPIYYNYLVERSVNGGLFEWYENGFSYLARQQNLW